MLPSQKPERGGTMRDSDTTDIDSPWRNLDDAKTRKPFRRATDSLQSRGSEITEWNVPKDLSESNDTGTPAVSGRRAVSHAAGTTLQSPNISDRKWSYVPQLPEHLSVKAADTRDRKVSWQDTALEDDPNPPAEYLADRRLSSARRAIEFKKEARRQRRSLKESGDYLGVQGINPETGKLDVLTPSPSTSDNSTDISDYKQKIEEVKQVLKDSRTHHKNAHLPGYGEREAKRLYLKREKEKRAKDEKRKQELAARQNQGLRWKRHSKQWSSAQEPALSPIAQSVRSGTPGSRELPALPHIELAHS